MGKLTKVLQKMKIICDENNGQDTFKSPVTIDIINAWENENNAKLCDELKEFYQFSNGMDLRIYFSAFSILPLENIIFKEGGVSGYNNSENYMEIGNFFGDGSVLCIDRNYNFCCAYEGDEIESCSLLALLEDELELLEEKIQ